MNNKLRLHGLTKLRLSQARYKKGNLYVSALLQDEKFIALDVRFFVEDIEAQEMIPTRNGFRIPSSNYQNLQTILGLEVTEIKDETVYKTKTSSLHIRYIDDKYGEAVDVRYYKVSEKYTGWERRGIRLKVDDFHNLCLLLENISIEECKGLPSIITMPIRESTINHKKQAGQASDSGTYINNVLDEILKI